MRHRGARLPDRIESGEQQLQDLFTIETQADGMDGAQKTDGIAVTNCPTGGQLPHSVFVAHDGGKGKRDRGGDFHFYPWEAIAGDRWIVDTQWSPRGRLER